MSAQTLDQFLAEHHIGLRREPSLGNPYMRHAMPYGTKHYRIVLRGPNGKTMTVHYSCGPGIKTEPTLRDVMETLRDDAQLFQSGECEAMDIPVAPVRRQTESLERILGEHFIALLATVFAE